MATVRMTDTLIDAIVDRFAGSFTNDRAALPPWPDRWPIGVGDELYSCLMPLDEEEKIRKMFPAWAVAQVGQMNASHDVIYGPVKLSQSRLQLPRSPYITVPGLKDFLWDGYNFTWRVEDLTQLQLPILKKFLEEVEDIKKQHAALDLQIAEESEKLRQFLDNQRTLQQAIAEFGPALMTWVPKYHREMYDKPNPPSKTKKDDGEIVPVDITSLAVRAVQESLGMNGENEVIAEAERYDHSYQKEMREARKARRARSLRSNLVNNGQYISGGLTSAPQLTITQPKFTI